MLLEVKKLLSDAQQAVARIVRYTSGKTFDEYLSQELLKPAVERQFEIVGEALNRLTKTAPEVAGQIAQCRRIISFVMS
jgi:uncharacterized protein with HEPN domain